MSIVIEEIKSTISTLLNPQVPHSSDHASFKKKALLSYTTKVKDELLTILSSDEEHDEVIFEKLKSVLHHHWTNTCGTALFYTAIPHERVSQCLYYIAEQLHQFYEPSPNYGKRPVTALEYLVPPDALKMDSEHSSFVSLCAVEPTIFSESDQADYNEIVRKLSYFNKRDQQLKSNMEESSYGSSTEAINRKEKELEQFNLLRERFDLLETKKLTHELEQQQINDGLLITHNGWLVPNRTLMNVMSCSILSDSQKTLIPISVLCQDTPLNPMGEGLLIKSEIERLKNHSGMSLALTMAQQELEHLQIDQSHLLGHLKTLVQELAMFGKYGIGSEQDASKLVSFSLIRFYMFFDQLNDVQKTHIPEKLMNEINKLRELSSERDKGAQAINILETCVNTRQHEIAKAMHGHEVLLASITTNQNTLSSLIHQAQRKVDVLKNDFLNAFNNGQYSGKDTLPITKTLIDSLELHISLNTRDDLLALLELPLDIVSPYLNENSQALFELIPSIDTLVEIILDTNITQLKTLLVATKPWLMQRHFQSMDKITSVLMLLDDDKCAELFCDLRAQKYDFWDDDYILPFIKSRPGILSVLSVSERLILTVYSDEIEIVKNIFEDNSLESAIVSKAIFIAHVYNKLDIVKYILSLTGDNKPDSAAVFKALHLSILQDNLDIVKDIFSLTGDNKLNAEAVDKALRISIIENKLDVVKYILSLPGDNKPNTKAVFDALHTSIVENKLDIAKYILSLPGDNKPNTKALSKALLLCVIDDRLDILKYIISLGGDNKPDRSLVCETFYAASCKDKLAVVKYILSRSAEYNRYSAPTSLNKKA